MFFSVLDCIFINPVLKLISSEFTQFAELYRTFKSILPLKAVTASIDSLGWAFLLAAGFKSRNCIWFSWRKSEYTQASEAIILLMPLTPEFRLNFNRIILIFTISSWRRTWWGPASPENGTLWSSCSSTSGSWPHSPSTWRSSWGSQSSTKLKHQTQNTVSIHLKTLLHRPISI